MTGFKDVNVGDKVRLTHESGTFVEGVVEWGQLSPGFLTIEAAHTYAEEFWSVEVLEHAPKPLPDSDGVYMPANQKLTSGPNVFVRYSGRWGDWESAAQYHHDSVGLVALVPSSDVDAARKAVVDEIAEWYRDLTMFPSVSAFASVLKGRFGGTA